MTVIPGFFIATNDFRRQHIGLYDFVHGMTASLWNTRWQVAGYLAAVPDAHERDLQARFVQGSDIQGVNVRGTFATRTWQEQQQDLARVALINTVALYEGWIDAITPAFPKPQANGKALQFPSTGVHGRTSRGVKEAVASMTTSQAPVMASDMTPVLRRKAEYRLQHLDELLLIYRYFKEARNAVVHTGGRATQELVDAHAALSQVLAGTAGLKELPRHTVPVLGEPVHLVLRGVTGLSAAVFYMVATIDAELSQTTVAESEFLQRFADRFRRPAVTRRQPRRSERIRRLVAMLGYSAPRSVQMLDGLLVAKRLIT